MEKIEFSKQSSPAKAEGYSPARLRPNSPLHDAERLLVGTLGVLLVFIVWSIGGTPLWSQITAAVISVGAFVAACLPRSSGPVAGANWRPFRRLAGFPVFWAGLLFLGLLAIQAFNPGWRREGTADFWWIEPIEHISALPAGVESPITNEGPIRWLLIWSIPFLATCAAWVGLTRRKAIYMLFWVMAMNGFVLAVVAFLQQSLGADLILWFYPPSSPIFLGSFPAHSHAAAYFLLMIGVAAGLAAHHFAESRKRFRKSSPTGLFIFLALVYAIFLLFSNSRYAAIAAGFMIGLLGSWFLFSQFFGSGTMFRKIRGALLCALLTAVAVFVADLVAAQNRMHVADAAELDEAIATGEQWRMGLEAGWQMFRERPIYGFGAGAAAYFYPEHFRNAGGEAAEAPPLHAEHAGSDWTRFPAELGVIGIALLAIQLVYLIQQFLRRRLLRSPLVFFTSAGLLLVSVLAFFDLFLRNPAVLTTIALLVVFSAALCRIERNQRAATVKIVRR